VREREREKEREREAARESKREFLGAKTCWRRAAAVSKSGHPKWLSSILSQASNTRVITCSVCAGTSGGVRV
jgi:hypothetical protein